MALTWTLSASSSTAQSTDRRWRLLPDSTVAGVTYHDLKLAAALRIVSDNERRALARDYGRAANVIQIQRLGAKADSAATANAIHDAQLGWDMYGACKEQNVQLQADLKASRRITVGGWVFRIALVALAVKGGVELHEEFVK